VVKARVEQKDEDMSESQQHYLLVNDLHVTNICNAFRSDTAEPHSCIHTPFLTFIHHCCSRETAKSSIQFGTHAAIDDGQVQLQAERCIWPNPVDHLPNSSPILIIRWHLKLEQSTSAVHVDICNRRGLDEQSLAIDIDVSPKHMAQSRPMLVHTANKHGNVSLSVMISFIHPSDSLHLRCILRTLLGHWLIAFICMHAHCISFFGDTVVGDSERMENSERSAIALDDDICRLDE